MDLDRAPAAASYSTVQTGASHDGETEGSRVEMVALRLPLSRR